MQTRTMTRARFLYAIRWILPPLLAFNVVLMARLPFTRPWEKSADDAVAAATITPSQKGAAGVDAPVQTAEPPTPISVAKDQPLTGPEEFSSEKTNDSKYPADTKLMRKVLKSPIASVGDTIPKEPPREPDSNIKKEKVADGLVLFNPAENGRSVGFLVDHQELWLEPGQSRRLAETKPRVISFHRGGDFGDAEHCLVQGKYRFDVSAQGWVLSPSRP